MCPQYNRQKSLLTVSYSQEQLPERRSDSRSNQQCHVPLCLHFRLLHPGIQGEEQLQHLPGRVRPHFTLALAIILLVFWSFSQPGLPLLCLICRNILQLTNHFEIADRNMTIEKYDEWYDYFNKTYPGDVAGLGLRVCDMQSFLDQVAVAKTQPTLCISAPHN